MKLLLLGTTGYHPNDRRQTACMMIPELGLVFDAGTAFYRVADYLTTDAVDIFLTHAHLDHVVGLTYLFDVMQTRPLKRITVHGEQEKLDAIKEHLFSKFLFPVDPPFEMQSLEPRVELADGAVLTHFPLTHPAGAVGYRIDWPDRSMAYVTDTVAAVDADYVEKIRGVDLLIHECHFNDGMTEQAELTGHSCLTPVAEVAAAAEVGRVALVHINPMLANDRDMDITQAQKIFANLELGQDRMEIDF